MLRKLTLIALIVGLCLMGAVPVLAQKTYSTPAEYEELTGNKIEEFNEAPMLKLKVAAGELPPVEERISEEPLVVEVEEIGRYGGAFQISAIDPLIGIDGRTARFQPIIKLSTDLKTIVPNIIKDWSWSKDLKTLTMYMRKGMKWSDGAPFTADDVVFSYEDCLLNDELNPVKPKRWSPGGEMAKFEKVDDYTVRFQFAVPYPSLIEILSLEVWDRKLLYPKHYLKKYHIEYNPEAKELAEEEDFDSWRNCFLYHAEVSRQQDLNRPVLDPWVLNRVDSSGNRYFERNPYYWKIDTAGNQLPYIDGQDRILVQNTEVLTLKAIAGEFSYAVQNTALKDYPLYKKGEEKGGYTTLLAKTNRGSEYAYSFNLNHKDPVLREIFNDIRFRQAMSLAINREEINDTFYFGKAVPRQATGPSSSPFYEEWMGKYYAEYDPKRANELLDEMGLKWDKNNQYRLRPDGEPLAITIEYVQMEGPRGAINELVREYWGKVGVNLAVKEQQRSLYHSRCIANEVDIGNWTYSNLSEIDSRARHEGMTPPWPAGHWGTTQQWWDWYNTNGESGEEPTEVVKDLYKTLDKWLETPRGSEKYLELGKKLFTVNVENLFVIGTIGIAPTLIPIKNDLRNVLIKPGMVVSPDSRFLVPYGMDQWFFAEE